MNTDQINTFGRTNRFTKKIFVKCCAVDLLPVDKISVKSLPCVYIVNLCNSNVRSDDCHWIAIYIGRERLEIFDSGGIISHMTNSHIVKSFVDRQSKRVFINTKQIQSMSSDRCGVLTLDFLYARAINVTSSLVLDTGHAANKVTLLEQECHLLTTLKPLLLIRAAFMDACRTDVALYFNDYVDRCCKHQDTSLR